MLLVSKNIQITSFLNATFKTYWSSFCGGLLLSAVFFTAILIIGNIPFLISLGFQGVYIVAIFSIFMGSSGVLFGNDNSGILKPWYCSFLNTMAAFTLYFIILVLSSFTYVPIISDIGFYLWISVGNVIYSMSTSILSIF